MDKKSKEGHLFWLELNQYLHLLFVVNCTTYKYLINQNTESSPI